MANNLGIFIIVIMFISFGSVTLSESRKKSKISLSIKVTSMSIKKNKEAMTAPKRRLLKGEDSDVNLEEECKKITGCDPNGDFTGYCPKFCNACLPNEKAGGSETYCGIAPAVPIYWEEIIGQEGDCEEIRNCNPNRGKTGCPRHCVGCDPDKDGVAGGTYCITGPTDYDTDTDDTE